MKLRIALIVAVVAAMALVANGQMRGMMGGRGPTTGPTTAPGMQGMGMGQMGMMGGMGMSGMGMMGGRCPYCGQPWNGAESQYSIVPEKLPAPKNQQWVDRLKKVLSLEKLSQAQYTQDSQHYNAMMPYGMIIPQEQNHITWITAMFKAYGTEANVEVPGTTATQSLQDALELARKLEVDLIPRYEELIKDAEDQKSAEILGGILMQTRMHEMMFTHALRMGMMRGGGGMMGR